MTDFWSRVVAELAGGMTGASSGVAWRHEHGGFPTRRDRVAAEAWMIAPRYTFGSQGIQYDTEDGAYIMIERYPLPAKWQERWARLLILFPENYPVTPPIGFYLNRQFALANGGSDPHLLGHGHDGAPDLTAQGWFWYCVRFLSGAGGWTPSFDHREADNLWTFLNGARETLTSES